MGRPKNQKARLPGLPGRGLCFEPMFPALAADERLHADKPRVSPSRDPQDPPCPTTL